MQAVDNRIIMDAFVIFMVIVVAWLVFARYQSQKKKLSELIKQQNIIEDRIEKAVLKSESTQKRSTANNGD